MKEQLTKKGWLWYLGGLLFVSFMGKILEVHQIVLFRHIHLDGFSFGEHPGRMTLLFLLPFGLYVWREKRWPQWKELPWCEKGLFLFFAYLVLHLSWAIYPNTARKGVVVFFFCILLYYATKWLVNSEADAKFLLNITLVSLFLTALVNFIQYHFFAIPVSWPWPSKHFVADLLLLGLLFSSFLLYDSSLSKFQKALLIGMIPFMYLMIIAAHVRAVILAAPVAVLLTSGIFFRRFIPWVIVASLLAFLLSFSVYKPTGSRLSQFLRPLIEPSQELFETAQAKSSSTTSLESSASSIPQKSIKKASPNFWNHLKLRLYKDPSLYHRFTILWPYALQTIQKHPLGIGIGSFRKKFFHDNRELIENHPWEPIFFTNAHSEMLQMGVGLGYPGIFVYLLFAGTVLCFFWVQTAQAPPHTFRFWFYLALLSYLIVHFLTEILICFHIKERFSLIFTLLLALGVRLAELYREQGENP